MHRFVVVALASAACTLTPSIARASDVEVAVYETGISGVTQEVASWTQDQNPTPIAYVDNYYTTVPVFDATGLGGDTAVTWYSGTDGQLGGFTNYDEDFNILAPTSYAGLASSPTFVPGRYDGVDIKPNFTYLDVYYTISVLPDPPVVPAFSRFKVNDPAVPEPGTWGMMLVGLGMIGLALRRRQMSAASAPE